MGRTLGGLHRVALHAVADPAPGFVGTVGARRHAHLFAHHEGGVEAHAELADDIHIVALGFGVVGLELQAAGMRDGAEVFLQLVLGHADARIAHRDSAGITVEGHMDGQFVLADLHLGIGEAFEVELVHGVGCVGDELAQEDFLIGVDRVDHEIEQLFALCLEFLHAASFLHASRAACLAC